MREYSIKTSGALDANKQIWQHDLFWHWWSLLFNVWSPYLFNYWAFLTKNYTNFVVFHVKPAASIVLHLNALQLFFLLNVFWPKSRSVIIVLLQQFIHETFSSFRTFWLWPLILQRFILFEIFCCFVYFGCHWKWMEMFSASLKTKEMFINL